MNIIAHRGASTQAPENTLTAFQKAWQAQADGIELDVHLSSDGILTVIHDATTRRTCQKNLRVADTPFAQLSQLCPAAKHDTSYAHERLARLEQVFEIAPKHTLIAIELKPDSPEPLDEALRQALDCNACPPHEQLILMSFHWAVMQRIAPAFPGSLKLWLYEGPVSSLLKRLQACRKPQFDGIGLSAKYPPTPEEASTLKNLGMKLSVWVENDPTRGAFWEALGFNYLTTDNPECFK